MQLHKYRWSRHYESAEEELHHFLQARNIQAESWELEMGDTVEPQTYDHDAKLFCAEGSMSIQAAGKVFSMQPGDALDLPAGTTCEISVGMTGVICYESPSK